MKLIFPFYTKTKDKRSTIQNTEFMVEAESLYFSSSKDKNHVMTRQYFGATENIREIYYVIFNVTLFKCKRIGNNTTN